MLELKNTKKSNTQQSDLLGTWKLLSFFMKDQNGERIFPYGETPLGYLIYTPEGLVSVHIMSSNRPIGGTQQYQSGTYLEKIESAENYGGYIGTYELQDNHVIHTAELSGFTRLINSPEHKNFSLDGNQLTISYKDSSSGKELDGALIWEKVRR